ncbi:kinase-like domain-containing protein [Parasitella parasitica]|nr:kinase-like domain-containing protein [Parasitella parasitica]
MSSPFHIRQKNTRSQRYLSRSVDTNFLKASSMDKNHNSLNPEELSFDSTRTDLSANSRDVIIADQWVVLGRIGEGSFGEVFEAEDIDTFRRYAIKREPLKMRHPQLKHESIIYDALAGGPGIPQCHWHGQHEGFDCIVIDLLGPNLNQLKEVTRKFAIDTVVDFGCQMVSILEHIHKRGLVYRDIKPDNFLFSSKCHLPESEMVEIPDDNGMPHITYINPTCKEVFKKWNEPHPKLYIVDFGLTTWWRDPRTDKPYPEVKKNMKNKTGTARYASLNVHRGKTHSRRDDIESLGYLLLDLVFGTLPWAGIQARNSRAGWDKMKQIKEDNFMSDICAGLPQGFLDFIEYARKLRFMEDPNYELLREFLSQSVNSGKYSAIIKSPFGGHTERKWLQDIERDSTPLTRADMPRPNSNVNSSRRNHYEPPSYHTNTPAPRQRRASYNSFNYKHQQQHDDVFAMEDLSNNLPQTTNTPPLQRHDYNNRGGRGIRGGHHHSQHNVNKRSSHEFNRTIHHDPPTSAGPSSFQKLLRKNKNIQIRVGWNSHKHDEAPWEPATDWEQPTVEKPDINITNATWGDDKNDEQWGEQQKDTWGIEEENGSWAATVEKPWA